MLMRTNHFRREILNSAIFLMVAALGCGGTRSSPEALPHDEARGYILEALAAWKGGKASKSLALRTPPLRFVDPDLDVGMTLLDYRIGPEASVQDYAIDIPVVLTLKDRRGRTVTRNAVYQVIAQPNPTVLRDDP